MLSLLLELELEFGLPHHHRTAGVQKLFHPTIPDGRTWSKFGARRTLKRWKTFSLVLQLRCSPVLQIFGLRVWSQKYLYLYAGTSEGEKQAYFC